MKTRLLILLTALMLSSCSANLRSFQSSHVLIDNGMSKKEVLEVMGAPGDRQFSGDDEAWQYCANSYGLEPHQYVIIWFYKGRVTGINSYKSSYMGFCQGAFKTIRWQEAPDRTIEIRSKEL